MSEQKPEFVPSQERIARMTKQFREERQRKCNKQYPPVDADSDVELEDEADSECRKR